MRSISAIPAKIYTLDELVTEVKRWRLKNRSVVFTNGVFDILHNGHISSLSEAASYGDVLIVGVNSDSSVKRLKGPERPVNDQHSRSLLLASLVFTDAIVIFDEDTPLKVITQVMPDVLVKGGDYAVDQIAGAKEVIANGGKVILANMVEGVSTTGIIEKMRK